MEIIALDQRLQTPVFGGQAVTMSESGRLGVFHLQNTFTTQRGNITQPQLSITRQECGAIWLGPPVFQENPQIPPPLLGEIS